MNKRTHVAVSVLAALSLVAPIVAPLLMPTAALAAGTTVVTPSSLNNWYLYDDQTDTQQSDTAAHGFVTGPGTPPLGTGSVHLTKTTTDKYGIATAQFASTSLASITALSYSTYTATGTLAQAPSLGFDVDAGTGVTGYQGRLTYEAYYTHTINAGTWQTWDTMDNASSGGNGNWWFSHAASTPANGKIVTTCTQSTPCTWAQVLAAFPNAKMANPGQLILRTNGADNEVFDGNVDNLTLGINGTNTIFDFDPTPAAPSTVKVTIDKYIDGVMATASSSNSASFPMNATWDAANIGSGSGSYTLGPTGFNSQTPYEAVTADMSSNASYSTSEDLSGAVVGADCSTGDPYMLAGYKTGDTVADAQSATLSTTTPSFTGMTSDKVVLVYNTQCLAAPVISTPTNGTTMTSANFTMVDWNDVSDNATPVTYTYQASNTSTTNPNGSFTAPVYTSAPLASSSINTSGTPQGTYYLHVQAMDADGNTSLWGPTSKVIIDNSATTTGGTGTTTGGISGTVTGTSTGQLAVTSITPIQTSGTADNTYADGWSYIFNITVPTNEPNLSMKFADWISSTTAATIAAGGNMQISSAQAVASTTPVQITAANVYSTPPLDMIGDMSTSTPGLQVQVLVQLKIPVNTENASYTTNYGVQTLP